MNLFRNVKRLDIPNAVRILVGHPIHRKETHARNTGNRLDQPLFLILELLVDHVMSGDVRVEVIRDEIVVAVLFDRRNQRRKRRGITKGARLDRVKDALQLRVQLEAAVEVSVAEILHVFRKVAEEEDVLLANLASNLNLRRI